jgi:hypothetical protein
MAERRMFAKSIVDSDMFLEMPQTSQNLYFHLSMRADDDGFINNPKAVMRTIGSKEDDMRLLIAKNYIIPFESGVVVIKHWRIHNYIRKDTYNETRCKTEKSALEIDENNAYVVLPSTKRIRAVDEPSTKRIRAVDEPLTQVRLGKDRLGKDRLELGKDSIDINADKPQKRTRFIPPTVDEVKAYCEERKNGVDYQRFIDYYTANGWKVGKNSMKDWKATVRTWERNGNVNSSGTNSGNNKTINHSYGELI